MLDHAERKFDGDTAETWLDGTSMSAPRDMGTWGPNVRDGGVTMGSGQAAIIRLVQELKLPYFPISVEKAIGKDAMNSVRHLVGYGTISYNRDFIPTRPKYRTGLAPVM